MEIGNDRDERYAAVVLEMVIGLTNNMSDIGLDLPTIEEEELLLVALATASERTSVVLPKEIPDYATEAVVRRGVEVGLIKGIKEEDLLERKADGRLDLTFIRSIVEQNMPCDTKEAFKGIRELMLNDWPILEKVRSGQRGDGPKLTFDVIKLRKDSPEERS